MIVVSHPFGNENVRSALVGLQKEKLISQFITTLATFPRSYLEIFSDLAIYKSLTRRQFDSSLRKITSKYPNKEIIRLIAQQFNIDFLISNRNGKYSTGEVIKQIDNKTANYILKNHNFLKAVYAYEDCAFQSFKAADEVGLLKVYDLPIGYWRCAREIFEHEKQKWPEWACTIPSLNDLEEKLIRKDLELESADVIYVASSYTAKTLNNNYIQNKSISIIPYGFPPVNETPRKWYNGKEKLKVLFVGSLTQRKGIAELLTIVEKHNKSVSLTIVGKKTTKDCKPLNLMIREHKYFPSLPHGDILNLMKTHDVLVFPSLFEGFGLVITEAMSQGMPVITTERTCGVDLIQHCYNGWLIEAGNIEMLNETLQKILDCPSLIEENGRNALTTAKKRPWSQYGNELANSIAECIS